MNNSIAIARTLLFVPGDRLDRAPKAFGSGADLVVIDLEDAVPAGSKAAARSAVIDLICGGAEAAVRINPPGTADGDADVTALARIAADLVVVVPKAHDPEVVSAVADAFGGRAHLVPLVETAAGVLAVQELAGARGVKRLAFGHLDFAAECGVDPDDLSFLAPVRLAIVLASVAGGLAAPIDGVCTDVRDEGVVSGDASRAARTGFGGKLCVHPMQIAPVHDAFRPTEREEAWARRVLEVAATGAIGTVDGTMVDRPVVLRAESILARCSR